MGNSVVDNILEDWRSAEINDKVRATLAFLEKVTLQPELVGPQDIMPLRAAGVSSQAIEDALFICFLFNVVDRVADTLDFEIPNAKGIAHGADHLLKRGY